MCENKIFMYHQKMIIVENNENLDVLPETNRVISLLGTY